MKKLVCLHTVRPLLDLFDRIAAKELPGTQLVHILDEPLLERVSLRGHLDPEDSLRVQSHRELSEKIGASAILVTCSTISPCVDGIRTLTSIPIFKIDE